jgi:hypothetical protein
MGAHCIVFRLRREDEHRGSGGRGRGAETGTRGPSVGDTGDSGTGRSQRSQSQSQSQWQGSQGSTGRAERLASSLAAHARAGAFHWAPPHVPTTLPPGTGARAGAAAGAGAGAAAGMGQGHGQGQGVGVGRRHPSASTSTPVPATRIPTRSGVTPSLLSLLSANWDRSAGSTMPSNPFKSSLLKTRTLL